MMMLLLLWFTFFDKYIQLMCSTEHIPLRHPDFGWPTQRHHTSLTLTRIHTNSLALIFISLSNECVWAFEKPGKWLRLIVEIVMVMLSNNQTGGVLTLLDEIEINLNDDVGR